MDPFTDFCHNTRYKGKIPDRSQLTLRGKLPNYALLRRQQGNRIPVYSTEKFRSKFCHRTHPEAHIYVSISTISGRPKLVNSLHKASRSFSHKIYRYRSWDASYKRVLHCLTWHIWTRFNRIRAAKLYSIAWRDCWQLINVRHRQSSVNNYKSCTVWNANRAFAQCSIVDEVGGFQPLTHQINISSYPSNIKMSSKLISLAVL